MKGRKRKERRKKRIRKYEIQRERRERRETVNERRDMEEELRHFRGTERQESSVPEFRIRKFLGLPDPDPAVRDMDPSIIKQKL
jgi:hypothetical protein